jgi:hypothetical protein
MKIHGHPKPEKKRGIHFLVNWFWVYHEYRFSSIWEVASGGAEVRGDAPEGFSILLLHLKVNSQNVTLFPRPYPKNPE